MKLPNEFPLDGSEGEKEKALREIMNYVEAELRDELECPSLPHTASLMRFSEVQATHTP